MNHNIKDIEEIAKELKNELEKIDDYQSFQNLKSKYLGKNGIIKSLMKNLKELDEEQRKNFGKNINELKNIIEEFFEEKLIILKEKESWIDVTIPGSKRKIGKISLISKTIRDIEEIFVGMGFSVAEGPEIENSWYNFDALNTPEWHPAREMQDTFYLSNDKKYLLRTHTSPVQIRTMLSNKPPLAIISPGRVY